MENLDNELMAGEFYTSLTRSNKEIKADRALAIIEDAEICYKRAIEDLTMRRKTLLRELDSSLDLSPSTVGSLMPAANFNAVEFMKSDITRCVELERLEEKIRIATARYNKLFKPTN